MSPELAFFLGGLPVTIVFTILMAGFWKRNALREQRAADAAVRAERIAATRLVVQAAFLGQDDVLRARLAVICDQSLGMTAASASVVIEARGQEFRLQPSGLDPLEMQTQIPTPMAQQLRTDGRYFPMTVKGGSHAKIDGVRDVPCESPFYVTVEPAHIPLHPSPFPSDDRAEPAGDSDATP